ncbi:hypothetical protein GYMLUDRAFT_35178 [Collybiopsis luxurians FD-317 M1]|nr:hypothetical protein GYMLUDRAFT_35178 [Collybiopsis luxurians FD-317 M1]
MPTASISAQDIAQASSSRAAQRKAKLMQIEKEQKLEEAEALKLTEEQRHTLLQSFSSVKFEFSDLDGLKWTGSALRNRASSRPDSSANLLPQFLNQQENAPRRARAQSLFYPSSPSMASSPSSSSYFPAELPKNSRGSEALAVLSNVDLAPSFDEKTIRAVISPVKSAFDTIKPPRPARDRPPTKQRCRRSISSGRHRSRSPVKGLFDAESSTLVTVKDQPFSCDAVEVPAVPAPAYAGGAPMERQISSGRSRSMTRTYAQTDITFGVSPAVATEVMRGRERVRGSRAIPKMAESVVESCTIISEEDEILESDLVGAVRFSPPKKSNAPKFQAFGGPWPGAPAKIASVDDDFEEDHLMTPTPNRYCGVDDSSLFSPTPVPQSHRSRADLTPFKRKRQPSEDQIEVIEVK